MSDYLPRSGSYAALAIEHLRRHGRTATTPLAEAVGTDNSTVATCLQSALHHGLVDRERVDGLLWWTVREGALERLPPLGEVEPDAEDDGQPVQRIVTAAQQLEAMRSKSATLLTEQLPTRPPRAFGCGIFSDGRLVLELASGVDVVLLREETHALVTFLDRALHEELTA